MYAIKNGKVHISLPVEHAYTCKSILSGKWDSSTKTWAYPISAIPEIYVKLVNYLPGFTHEEVVKDELARASIVKSLADGSLEPRPHEFLFRHQRVCRDIAAQYDRFGMFLQTGTGKTALSISIIKDNPHITWLVICPKAIIRTAWMEDLQKFAPDLKVRPLSKNFTKTELKDFIEEGYADMYIVNPESFDVDKAKALGVNGLIFDESVKLKNPQAKITKKVTELAKSMRKVYLLSGYPAPNNELEYFSQMRIVGEEVFGVNFYKFREFYFKPSGYMGYDWKMPKDMKEPFTTQLARKSIFITKEECLDLPEKTFLVREVELGREAMKYYKEMEKFQLVEFKDVTTVAPNKLTQLMKLRQITSGFMLDATGSGQQLHLDKLNELAEVVEELGDKQAIIWINFKCEVAAIANLLENLDKTYGTAYGGTRDIDSDIRDFKEGKTQFIIAHPQSVKYGVTWTNCSYAIYFGLSYSFDDFVQSQDRIHRIGQNSKCTYIVILAKNTIEDKVIWKVLHDKADLSEEIRKLVKGVK